MIIGIAILFLKECMPNEAFLEGIRSNLEMAAIIAREAFQQSPIHVIVHQLLLWGDYHNSLF